MSTVFPRYCARSNFLPVESLRMSAGAGFGGLATAPEYWETFCDDVLSCFACFEEPQPATATAAARSRAAGSVLPLSDIWGVVRLRHASQRLLKTRCGVVRARGRSGSRRQPGYR